MAKKITEKEQIKRRIKKLDRKLTLLEKKINQLATKVQTNKQSLQVAAGRRKKRPHR